MESTGESRTEFFWGRTFYDTSLQVQIYSLLLPCAILVCAILVFMGYFTGKNNFLLDEKVTRAYAPHPSSTLTCSQYTAIITGGSQGLGLSVAKHLASKGANVVIVAQDVPKLEAALEEIKVR
jgi:short chain dehydrogenase